LLVTGDRHARLAILLARAFAKQRVLARATPTAAAGTMSRRHDDVYHAEVDARFHDRVLGTCNLTGQAGGGKIRKESS
jgi:hypothetical protein